MLISIHLGLHQTDADQLVQSLRKSSDILAAEDVALPLPAHYRTLLGDMIRKLKGAPADPDAQALLFDAMFDSDSLPGRAVISHDNFICARSEVFFRGSLYHRAGFKTRWLRNVFAGHEVEFHLAIRNPAGFVPALAQELGTHDGVADILRGADPMSLRWPPVIEAIRASNPDTAITVWAYEDTPVIWSQVLRHAAGIAPGMPLAGSLDMVEAIIDPEGMAKLRTLLNRRVTQSGRLDDGALAQIIAAFLARYAIPGALEDEIDLPDWDSDLIEALTATYDADLNAISQIEGVRMLLP